MNPGARYRSPWTRAVDRNKVWYSSCLNMLESWGERSPITLPFPPIACAPGRVSIIRVRRRLMDGTYCTCLYERYGRATW